MEKGIREYGIRIGEMKPGKRNSIADVEGVRIGHITYNQGETRTGLTAILGHDGNHFKEKLPAASYTINGFGKSNGLIQVDEMGNIETPIILTNTLSVGSATSGLVKYMLKDNPDIGLTTGTVNPLICECNDGHLNRIRDMIIKEEDVFKAIERAGKDFEQGNVGAGTGMVCYGLKGGIGSSSRLIEYEEKTYTLGVLSLTNFGQTKDLIVNNKHIGGEIEKRIKEPLKEEDKGSIIVILATDLPLSYRQLKRLIKRTYPGISKTGSYTSNGSGEIILGFSTANKISHYSDRLSRQVEVLNEDKIDLAFRAAKEATEESILNSMIYSETVIGRDGNKVYSLREFEDLLK